MGSSQSSQSSQRSQSKGGTWTYKIYFDPEAKDKKEHIPEITDRELKSKSRDLIGRDEKIDYVRVFKCPLYSWQLTDFVMYHMFVEFETKNWWWTMEKNSKGITIQRSKERWAVRNYSRMTKRNPCSQVEEDSGRTDVFKLIDWLYHSDQLNKKYNVWDRSCQEFGKAVFDQVAANKTLKVWPFKYLLYFTFTANGLWIDS